MHLLNTNFLATVGIALCTAGCVQIDGGAAEANWTLRTVDGQTLGTEEGQCTTPGVSQIRLVWDNIDQNIQGFQDFACRELHGATPFNIDEGQVAISFAPVCVGGSVAAAGTFQAPAPVLRQIKFGEVASLGTVLIEVVVGEGSLDTCPM